MPIERVSIDDREQWLADRLAFCNASEMATICGEGGYASLAELYAEKKGLRPPRFDDAAMRRGRWGESAVFQAIADTYPEWKITRSRVHLRDTDRRIAATPDGFLITPDRPNMGVVETKVVAASVFRQKWLDDDSDGSVFGDATPPIGFLLQLATGMMLAECNWGIIAALVVTEWNWVLRAIEIERDPVLEDRIVINSGEFLRNHLDAGIMPPFDPRRDEALVKHLFPKDTGTEIDLSADNRAAALVEQYVESNAAMKRLEKECDAIKVELQAKLGDATYGRIADGRRIVWKQQHRKAYSVAASDHRRFSIGKAKGE